MLKLSYHTIFLYSILGIMCVLINIFYSFFIFLFISINCQLSLIRAWGSFRLGKISYDYIIKMLQILDL
jgi:hypothetical protein